MGGLKSATEGVFPSQKLADYTNQSFPPRHFVSPTEPVCQHSTMGGIGIYVPVKILKVNEIIKRLVFNMGIKSAN